MHKLFLFHLVLHVVSIISDEAMVEYDLMKSIEVKRAYMACHVTESAVCMTQN